MIFQKTFKQQLQNQSNKLSMILRKDWPITFQILYLRNKSMDQGANIAMKAGGIKPSTDMKKNSNKMSKPRVSNKNQSGELKL